MARQYGTNSQSAANAQKYLSRQSNQKASLFKTAELVVSLVLVGVGVINVIGGFATTADCMSKARDVSKVISEREAVLKEAQESGKDAKPVVQTENVVSNSASDDGAKVCDLQNQLNVWVKKEADEGKTTLYPEHQELLNDFRQYFPVATSNAIARTWCEYGTWYFNNTYPFEGNNTSVVWECYADGDTRKSQMLAFVTAKYDATTHTFTNGEIIRTKGLTDLKASLSNQEPEVVDPPVETVESEEPTAETVEPATVESTAEPEPIIIQVSPEPEYFYGWSTRYNCWGYFAEDGRFLTEEQYNNEVNGYGV